MAEPIDLLFGLWTLMRRTKHTVSGIDQVAPMCPREGAHWSHLANAIEPSVCDSDAALCQIGFHHLLITRTQLASVYVTALKSTSQCFL